MDYQVKMDWNHQIYLICNKMMTLFDAFYHLMHLMVKLNLINEKKGFKFKKNEIKDNWFFLNPFTKQDYNHQ